MSGRVFLAVMLAVTTLSLSVGHAVARPAGPTDCTFSEAFAAFREALGVDLVGECESQQQFDEKGNSRQDTSEGILYWSAKANFVGFTDGIHVWWDGPAGIGTSVTIDGLSDASATRTLVVAPAARVFDLATIDPYELDDDWDYDDLPEGSDGSGNFDCLDNVPDRHAGTVQVWLINYTTNQRATHLVSALPDGEIAAWRADLEQTPDRCGEWTANSEQGQFKMRVETGPFVKLGDDSMTMRIEMTHQESGVVRHYLVGIVRYGGVLSMVGILSEPDQALDAIRPDVEKMTKHAHDRIQTTAWYLRD
jgi:hypothetical protein